MHKTIELTLLLLLPIAGFSVYAQNFVFPMHQGDIWQYTEPPPPPSGVVEARVVGDTLMPNGNVYTNISWYNYGNSTPIWIHYYRQVGDTLFEYLTYTVNNGATHEVIRYNFGLPSGAIVTSYALLSDTIITSVDSIGIVYVAGHPKTSMNFYIRFKHSTMFWYDKITDGLGLLDQKLEGGEELALVGTIIDSVRLGTILAVSTLRNPNPTNYGLAQNYPNPFNPSTTITFSLPTRQFVKVSIYDVLGRLACVLFTGTQPAGSHSIVWNANDAPSGVYFCRLQTEQIDQTRKLILVR